MAVRSAAVWAVLVTAMAPQVGAQTVTGTVREIGSGEPIAGADVRLMDADDRTLSRTESRSDGHFTFGLSGPGSYRLGVTRIGYAPARSALFTVAAQDAASVDVELAIQPIRIEPLTVDVTRSRIPHLEQVGFYRRMERNAWGTFLTEGDIDPMIVTRVTDIFRYVPFWRITRNRDDVYDVARRGHSPTVVIDGFVVRRCDTSGAWEWLVPASSVQAMEIYDGWQGAPVEYRLGGLCPVVLIWTR